MSSEYLISKQRCEIAVEILIYFFPPPALPIGVQDHTPVDGALCQQPALSRLMSEPPASLT